MNLNVPLDLNSLSTGDASGDDSAMVISQEGSSYYRRIPVDREDEKVEEWISRIQSDFFTNQGSCTLDTSKCMKILSMLIEEVKKKHSSQVIVDVLNLFLILNLRFYIYFLRCVLITVSM